MADRTSSLKRVALLVGLLVATAGASVADLNQAGIAAYGRGEYADAERLFSRALAHAPGDPLLHYHRAVALTKLGRWRDAATAYETVLRMRPSPEVSSAARQGLQALAPMTRPVARAIPETIEVPIESYQRSGVWIVDVLVNDMRKARFLVDTGATFCMVSPELARALDLRTGSDTPWVELLTASGRTRGPIVDLASLRVGDAEAEKVRTVIHDMHGLDGLLGNTFLARYTVTLDPARRILALKPR